MGNVVYWSLDYRKVYVELLFWDCKVFVELFLKIKEQVVMVGVCERLYKLYVY